MTQHQTDPQLLAKLKESAKRPMTPEQRRRQKISFILGTLGDNSTITREQIEAHLDDDSPIAA